MAHAYLMNPHSKLAEWLPVNWGHDTLSCDGLSVRASMRGARSRQHAQSAVLAVPSWRYRARLVRLLMTRLAAPAGQRHPERGARPLAALPLPRGLEPTAFEAAKTIASDHTGADEESQRGARCPQTRRHGGCAPRPAHRSKAARVAARAAHGWCIHGDGHRRPRGCTNAPLRASPLCAATGT